MKNNMDRTERKNCFVELGIERFEFNRTEELLVYRYICCQRLSNKEWKKCKNKSMPYSYKQWEKQIREKYEACSLEQLNEFEKYLEIGKLNKDISKSGNDIVYAAILSAFFSAIFTYMFTSFSDVRFYILMIIIAPVCIALMIPIYHVIQILSKNHIERKMYEDFQSVIKTIKEEKN